MGHETAGGAMSYAPGRFGVLWTLQEVPSQRSATVDGPPGPKASPVAVHAEGEEQETLLKKSPFPSVPGGVTADCTVQAAPFHRSASSPESVFPTAVQAEAEMHETALRPYPVLAVVGDGWMLHLVPFHCSATVPSALNELSTMPPTAVHRFAEVHETPNSELFDAPAGAGTGWLLQLVPSHLSAMTCPPLSFPTAVHAFGEVHEIAFKNAPGLSDVGVGWMLQLVPCQRSVSVPTGLPELSNAAPTATQVEGDLHETPVSALSGAPSGFGVGVIRHAVPSQNSATVPLALPNGSAAWPTAMQADVDLHDTPRSCAPLAPCGLIVGWTLH